MTADKKIEKKRRKTVDTSGAQRYAVIIELSPIDRAYNCSSSSQTIKPIQEAIFLLIFQVFRQKVHQQ